MAKAKKPALNLTAERGSEISNHEETDSGILEPTDRMLLGPGVLVNEMKNAPSTISTDLQRHRRKKNRPVQYRPVDNFSVGTQSKATVDENQECPTNCSSTCTSSNERVSQAGQARWLGLRAVESQGAETMVPSGDHAEEQPVDVIGITDIHRTIARQLEQASAIADCEHQPCPFCPYVFSSTVFLVRHLKYRHGVSLEMQIGTPTDTKASHLPSPHRQLSGNCQREPSSPLPGLDSCSDDSNFTDKQIQNGDERILSSADDVIAGQEVDLSNPNEFSWTGVEGQRLDCSKESILLSNMGHLMRPKLNQMVSSNRSGQCVIICDKCTRAFTNLEDLEEHQRIHNVAKTFECWHCHKLFQTSSSLKKHTKLHTDGKMYACDYCDKSFAAAAYLKTHLRLHTKQKPFLCKHCGKAFAASGTLISHERIHINDKPYGCEFCGKRFRQGSHLTRHKVIHSNIKPHVCSKCNRAFADVANLRRHERIHIQDNPNVCRECGKSFINLSSLKKHERLHTNEKPYICRHCNKPFASSGNLISHERTHTNKRPYICKECGKAFTQSSHLKAHMGTHSTETLYVCKQCGRGFTQRSTLCVHERIHLNKKPYKCKVCGRAFTQSSTLKSHMRTHTKERAHACKVCGKAFSARGNLRSHELIHTDKKPFRCSACPKSFKQGSTLRAHERTHTNEKPYVCRACGKTFADGSNLKAHTLRIHSKNTVEDHEVLHSDAQQIDALIAQTNETSVTTKKLCASNRLKNDISPGDSSQSHIGVKTKKTVDGLTSRLMLTEAVNTGVQNPAHHTSQVKQITNDKTQERNTCVLEDSQRNGINSVEDQISTSCSPIGTSSHLYSHWQVRQPHRSSSNNALDLSRGQGRLRSAEALPCDLNRNKTKIQSLEDNTQSQTGNAIPTPQLHHQTEPVRDTKVQRLGDGGFTFEDYDDLGSLPTAGVLNNSESELPPVEVEEDTVNADLKKSFAERNSDFQDSCHTIVYGVCSL